MSIPEKISELQGSLESANGAVAEAIKQEISRLTRQQNANARRIFKDHHCGTLNIGDTVYSYDRSRWSRDNQPDGAFRVRTIVAISPDGSKVAWKKNYDGRPEYEAAETVWSADHKTNLGVCLPYGTWRKTKQDAWVAWANNAAAKAVTEIERCERELANAREDAEELNAFIDREHIDFNAIPEVKR